MAIKNYFHLRVFNIAARNIVTRIGLLRGRQQANSCQNAGGGQERDNYELEKSTVNITGCITS